MATSEVIKIFAISVNIPGTRFKLDNRFGCGLVISEVDPINVLEDQAAAEPQAAEAEAGLTLCTRGTPTAWGTLRNPLGNHHWRSR